MVLDQEERGPWETESGLIDDVDGWVANPRFGVKEDYVQAVQVAETTGGVVGLMFIVDIEDDNGELLGSQGWSVGTGWEVSDDGLVISHPKRKNVVTNSMYGLLQVRVVKELGVDMSQFGLPTEALSWDGLGFHWMQTPHETVGGKPATGLMPTAYLGVRGEEGAEAVEPAEAEEATPAPAPARPVARPAPARPAPARAAAKPALKGASAAEQAALKLVADCGTVKEFVLKAVKVPEITADDAFMARCLDDSAAGFFKQHKGK